MPGTVSFLKQSFPGKPAFTEEHMPELTGKIAIVTGSNTGLGKEVAQILYAKGARVYMMARSEANTKAAISNIQAAVPRSSGELIYIPLDLSDFNKVKAAANAFLAKEQSLHLLINNAGVGYPPKGSRTAQGWELRLGVNCLGTWLFTQLLTPTVVSTAKVAPPNSVRVVWVSSSAAEAVDPKKFVEGLPSDNQSTANDKYEDRGSFLIYGLSKLGGYYYGAEYAARHKKDGVVSVSLNPGNLDSDFWREQGALTTCVLRKTLLHPPKMGAYTVLFAGLSPEVTLDKSGQFIAPWGQLWQVSKDMVDAAKPKSENGAGEAASFWTWSEKQLHSYL
ncbi:NAD(P)-binding protein [Xylaria cf. heliscus]|nr:NAD(P)-binding protein [Xylaria cf. heliscus]